MDCNLNSEALSKYRIDLPYPPVAVQRPNSVYAKIVSSAYGGKGSELSSVAQYICHSYYLGNYPDVALVVRSIAAVEMTHLQMLGQLILCLGCHPVFASYENNTFWNGTFPDYSRNIDKILQADIKQERETIARYRKMLLQIQDEQVGRLLRRLIIDEEHHLNLLLPLYEKYRSK